MNAQVKNAKLLEQLLAKSGKTLEWLSAISSAKLRSEGYIDLGIDFLGSQDNKVRFALSHYSKHPSGDMMADPDMEFELIDGKFLTARTYQNDFLCYFDSVEVCNELQRPDKQRQMDGFATQWLSNLIDQGHRVETVVSG